MSMSDASLVWGATDRWPLVAAIAAAALAVLLLSYARGPGGVGLRSICATLKALAFATLLVCLLEPLLSGTRPRPGANALALLVDTSQSMTIAEGGKPEPRGEVVRSRLDETNAWRRRLDQDFDVRTYAFANDLSTVNGLDDLVFDGSGSNLAGALGSLAERFEGLPLAGILVFTDGNATDARRIRDLDPQRVPPIYPVVPEAGGRRVDVALVDVSVNQSNFEAAPVTVRADVRAEGAKGRRVVAVVRDAKGQEVQRQRFEVSDDRQTVPFRFQIRPDRVGVQFYEVRAGLLDDDGALGEPEPRRVSKEPTLENNRRLVVVDRGGGPYRVLYLSGRPNWEFKFLRRALDEDDQIDLIGLIRIANRKPKFDFRDPRSRQANTLFEGFDDPDEETAERYDEPVIVRLGTEDDQELRSGFPETAEDLFAYDALIIDDLEIEFFSQDQRDLIRDFVSRRGGGFLMLGGPSSFADGSYDRTPIGDLLPIYLDRLEPIKAQTTYRLQLTREGWLQPWVRLRSTEDEERRRLASMSAFQIVNPSGGLKPGATVLARVLGDDGVSHPALVSQSFGAGRAAALVIADLWRWGMRRDDPGQSDLERGWRQMVRWLVADVPQRVEVEVQRDPDDPTSSLLALTVRVRDPAYLPLDNAKVSLKIEPPEGSGLTLEAVPDDREPGTYTSRFLPRRAGAYRITAMADGPDGTAIGTREAGWVAEPGAEEFARLDPDLEAMERLAERTGGELLRASDLDEFARMLPTRSVPISEPWTAPLWHTPVAFLFVLACLTVEWGLRRARGLA